MLYDEIRPGGIFMEDNTLNFGNPVALKFQIESLLLGWQTSITCLFEQSNRGCSVKNGPFSELLCVKFQIVNVS